jgi:hypothetical protein
VSFVGAQAFHEEELDDESLPDFPICDMMLGERHVDRN